MKVATIYANFLLPENFEGDFNDVLREIIKYRESRDLTNLSKDKSIPYTDEEMTILQMAHSIYWKHFCDLILDADLLDARLHGSITVKTREDDKWVDLEKT